MDDSLHWVGATATFTPWLKFLGKYNKKRPLLEKERERERTMIFMYMMFVALISVLNVLTPLRFQDATFIRRYILVLCSKAALLSLVL